MSDKFIHLKLLLSLHDYNFLMGLTAILIGFTLTLTVILTINNLK